MVEFINRLTESQASDKVHKVLRTDADKKRKQPEQEKSGAEKKDEAGELKDEMVLSKPVEKTATAVEPENEPANELKSESKMKNNKDNENPNSHIDVTA